MLLLLLLLVAVAGTKSVASVSIGSRARRFRSRIPCSYRSSSADSHSRQPASQQRGNNPWLVALVDSIVLKFKWKQDAIFRESAECVCYRTSKDGAVLFLFGGFWN